MFDRKLFKKRGLKVFGINPIRCILVALLIGLITSGARAQSRRGGQETIDSGTLTPAITYDITSDSPEQVQQIVDELAQYMPGSYFSTFLLVGGGVLACIAILLQIFVFSVLQVGGCCFFLRQGRSRGEEKSFDSLLVGFKNGNYGTVVLTQFLRELFIVLWSLLFIIPGIIKAYEYCMMPYLLADYPDITRQEAFAMSKKMMDGNKMNMFILELSFIGWFILGALTQGIANVLFVNPYVECTRAEAYLALKAQTFGD